MKKEEIGKVEKSVNTKVSKGTKSMSTKKTTKNDTKNSKKCEHCLVLVKYYVDYDYVEDNKKNTKKGLFRKKKVETEVKKCRNYYSTLLEVYNSSNPIEEVRSNWEKITKEKTSVIVDIEFFKEFRVNTLWCGKDE